MTKFAKAILFVGAGLLALAGAAEAGTVRVTIAEYSKGTGPYFEAAAKAFEAANPGTKIQIEVVPWDNLQQKLTTDISAGANADLSIIGTRWLLDYVSQGIVAPLDSYITPEFKARFIDIFLTPSIMKGKVYGLPIAASARAMYYNKDVFDEGRLRQIAGDLGRLQNRRREDQGEPAAAFSPSACKGRRSRPTSITITRFGRTAARSSRTASRASTARRRSRRRRCTRASSTAA